MVFKVQRVPALAVHLLLPLCERLFEFCKLKGALQEVRYKAVCLHVGKVYHHVEHLVGAFFNIAQCDRGLHAGTFADGEAVVKVQNIALKLGKVIVHLGEIGVILHACCGGELHLGARKPLCLGDVGDDVLAEAVNAHVQPKAHDFLDLLTHLGVCHVEVGLLFGENVQVPFVEVLVILPRAPLKQAVPVVRRRIFALALAPVVVIVIGVILALFALNKPRVLIGGVVHDKIHEYAQTALVRTVKHFLEDVEVAVIGVDAAVIGDIVAVIGVRRGVQRRKPNAVNIQRGDVVKLAVNAPQVADTVAVAVAEAPRPYLIDRHFFVPAFFLHE